MKLSTLFLLVFLIFGLAVGISLCVDEGEEAYSAVEEADNALKQAFAAVLEVERTGGNVSSLVARLNDAGEVLAEAEVAYRNGNWDRAAGKASECVAIADGVFVEALGLKDLALEDAQTRLSHTLMFSIAGAVVFVTGLVLAWVWFTHFYFGRLLKMRPEVEDDVEA